MWQGIVDKLSESTGQSLVFKNLQSVTEGCIHNAHLLETNKGNFFVKTNKRIVARMFEEEFTSLKVLQKTNTLRCPNPILAGETETHSYLILEYIEFESPKQNSMALLGRKLAELHKHSSEYFGWPTNNYIGSTPQQNKREIKWAVFFLEHRLKYQIKLAESNGLTLSHKSKLYECYDFFFKDYSPTPALLHGDLWNGNIAFSSEGLPIIFDPASYYGDRETDLAFSEMFGGFSPEFYTAYNEAYQLDSGYKYRKRLYNLYHELNHFNLFGGGYGAQVQINLKSLLTIP